MDLGATSNFAFEAALWLKLHFAVIIHHQVVGRYALCHGPYLPEAKQLRLCLLSISHQ